MKQIALGLLLAIAVSAGLAGAPLQTAQKPISKTIKVKKVKAPKPPKSPKIKPPKLTPSEKAIQEANKKKVERQQRALKKSQQKVANDYKRMQKAYAKQLRQMQRNQNSK